MREEEAGLERRGPRHEPPCADMSRRPDPTFDEETHWAAAARELHWFDANRGWLALCEDVWLGWSAVDASPVKHAASTWRPWLAVVDRSEQPFVRWFVEARTNAAFNELDRHVLSGSGAEVATVDEPEDHGACKRRFSRHELLKQACLAAHALREGMGVAVSQIIAFYLPNDSQAVTWMEAAKRLAAPFVAVAGGTSSSMLALRLADTNATVLVVSSGLLSAAKEAVSTLPVQPKLVLLDDRSGGRADSNTRALLATANAQLATRADEARAQPEEGVRLLWTLSAPRPVESSEPLFILYTSGSTGKPKGIVHVHGGYQVGLCATARTVFALRGGVDVLLVVATPGWITGQSYMMATALLCRAPSVLLGGSPTAPVDRVAMVVARQRVTILKAGSTFLRMLMASSEAEGLRARHDLTTLRLGAFCAEPVNEQVHRFASQQLTSYYINCYWATEHGGVVWGRIHGSNEQTLRPDTRSWPMPWIEGEVMLRAEGGWRRAIDGEQGEVVVRKQYPYMALTVWHSAGFGTATWRGDAKRWSAYFEAGVGYLQGDAAVRHKGGAFTFHGRSDEVINIGGNRIGTEEIESALLCDHAAGDSPLRNCLVVGMDDTILGTVPCAFIVLQPGVMTLKPSDLSRLRALVKIKLGAVAIPAHFVVVGAFPETYSGKYLRRLLRAMLNDTPLGDLGALRNPECVAPLAEAVQCQVVHAQQEPWSAEERGFPLADANDSFARVWSLRRHGGAATSERAIAEGYLYALVMFGVMGAHFSVAVMSFEGVIHDGRSPGLVDLAAEQSMVLAFLLLGHADGRLDHRGLAIRIQKPLIVLVGMYLLLFVLPSFVLPGFALEGAAAKRLRMRDDTDGRLMLSFSTIGRHSSGKWETSLQHLVDGPPPKRIGDALWYPAASYAGWVMGYRWTCNRTFIVLWFFATFLVFRCVRYLAAAMRVRQRWLAIYAVLAFAVPTAYRSPWWHLPSMLQALSSLGQPLSQGDCADFRNPLCPLQWLAYAESFLNRSNDIRALSWVAYTSAPFILNDELRPIWLDLGLRRPVCLCLLLGWVSAAVLLVLLWHQNLKSATTAPSACLGSYGDLSRQCCAMLKHDFNAGQASWDTVWLADKYAPHVINRLHFASCALLWFAWIGPKRALVNRLVQTGPTSSNPGTFVASLISYAPLLLPMLLYMPRSNADLVRYDHTALKGTLMAWLRSHGLSYDSHPDLVGVVVLLGSMTLQLWAAATWGALVPRSPTWVSRAGANSLLAFLFHHMLLQWPVIALLRRGMTACARWWPLVLPTIYYAAVLMGALWVLTLGVPIFLSALVRGEALKLGRQLFAWNASAKQSGANGSITVTACATLLAFVLLSLALLPSWSGISTAAALVRQGQPCGLSRPLAVLAPFSRTSGLPDHLRRVNGSFTHPKRRDTADPTHPTHPTHPTTYPHRTDAAGCSDRFDAGGTWADNGLRSSLSIAEGWRCPLWESITQPKRFMCLASRERPLPDRVYSLPGCPRLPTRSLHTQSGRMLWFVGDSESQQHYRATACRALYEAHHYEEEGHMAELSEVVPAWLEQLRPRPRSPGPSSRVPPPKHAIQPTRERGRRQLREQGSPTPPAVAQQQHHHRSPQLTYWLAHASSSSRPSNTAPLRGVAPQQACLPQCTTITLRGRVVFQACSIPASMPFSRRPIDGLVCTLPLLDAVEFLLQLSLVRANDYVVLNEGLWFEPALRLAKLSAMTARLANGTGVLSKAHRAGAVQLAWRESAPQSYGVKADGGWNTFQGGVVDGWYANQAPCVPVRSPKRAPEATVALERLESEAHMPVVRVWQLGVSQWDVRLERRTSQVASKGWDCTHACEPSGLLEAWVDATLLAFAGANATRRTRPRSAFGLTPTAASMAAAFDAAEHTSAPVGPKWGRR